MKIFKDFPLHNLTTFDIGGRARYFTCVFSIKDVKDAFNFAHRHRISIFVLGGGSNILISDTGFNGLVLKNKIKGIEFEVGEMGEVFLRVGAGENWDNIVEKSVLEGLSGIEALSGIPGSVGGAVVQNIGAYGSEISSSIYWVEVFDPNSFLTFKLSSSDCLYSYRSSIFKTKEGKHLIVLRVSLKLKKCEECEVFNKEVLDNIKDKKRESSFVFQKVTPSLALVRESVLEIRSSKLPPLSIWGTAGSFFKNPKITKTKKDKLVQEYPEMPYFEYGEEEFKLSAGWLIENIGDFKGVILNNAGVYEKHALIIVNHGGAKAKNIKKLAEIITSSIKSQCKIELEWEVVCL